jgi:hypothetical protein
VKSSEATGGEGDKGRRDIYVHSSIIIPPPSERDCKELSWQQLEIPASTSEKQEEFGESKLSERERERENLKYVARFDPSLINSTSTAD